MRRTVCAVAVVVAVVGVASLGTVPATAAPGKPFPDTIALPDGFFPEGIAIDGRTAYVGSLIDGSIHQQDLKTANSQPFAGSPGPGTIAVGLDVDRYGRLWVAGGGPALDPAIVPGFRVYDTTTGQLLVDQPVPAGFVNDVIVTADAAWFTDSFSPNLIRVPLDAGGAIGTAELVPLVGDWVQVAGFNANGIEATADGGTLVVAQSTAPDGPGSALYLVPADIDAAVLEATRIELDGVLPGADGLVLVGRTLYVVAGPPGVVELRLSLSKATGRIVDTTAVPGGITPTTAARFGSRLYVVDAKFPLFGDPTVPFVTTAIRR